MPMTISNALAGCMPKAQGKARQCAASDDTVVKTVEETEAATVELSESAKAYYSGKDEPLSEVTQRHESLGNGSAATSDGCLRDCLSDEGKPAALHDMPQKADAAATDAEEDPDGCQSMETVVDEDAKTEAAIDKDEKAETGSGKVGINAGKLARMLAAAKTKAQVQAVIAKIQQDLKECEAGKAQGMDVDEASVRAARSILSQAQQRKGEAASREATPEEEMAFSLAGLL